MTNQELKLSGTIYQNVSQHVLLKLIFSSIIKHFPKRQIEILKWDTNRLLYPNTK